ncbi:hypothetical protein Q5M85_19315 [Paraclostridium bifermentans]|nr:hypothetical protein [Paraclostridium bifermentans]
MHQKSYTVYCIQYVKHERDFNYVKKLSEVFNGFSKQILALERINSQRCVGKDLDTTKLYLKIKDNTIK